MLALLTIVVAVLSEHEMRVREHKGGGGKIDTMLSEVDTICVYVPLESHSVNTIVYTTGARCEGGEFQPVHQPEAW